MSRMWNPMLETMDRAELRSLQVDRFREQVRHAYEHSPFYRRKLDAAGIDPDDIRTYEDVREVPTTKKGELREAQGGEPFPYGDLLAASPEEVTEYHQTSGTTGEPVRQADSWGDWEWWGDCWATVLWAQGIRPDDRVFFPFSYNVFVAFWAAHYACERIGAEVVPGGNLSSAQRVRKMREVDVTAFASTPTYALRLAEVAREEGFEPTDFAVDTVVCAGEPGASVPGTKARIEEAWGADVYDHAGATEAGAWGFSCDGESVGLHLNEGQFLIEVLDEDGEPVEPGETGEIVITPLNRTAQPYIRFELRDEIGLRESAAVCDCGRTFRFAEGGVLGRLDDLTKVNGVLLAPTAIEDVVRSYDGVSDEYEVIIDGHEEKPDLDVVTVVAEENPETGVPASEAGDELRKRLKQTTSITCRVDVVAYESLDRPELKADRLDDRRENHV
ncbi:phenylacetate-CoA ligase [Halarchaeum rubridurum]|uniref:Phenylacetate--CoA ligase n=1 Tax=Halarchaeum rubridurum TaxID=489911 RepID=A0A830FYR9_9EURY|nr:AMP-binding protein [Halarchaeum rubridurum]MBP1954474.1 phenylacetate-CoA ligase [Halarchaeum rubridurum]GGM61308.1 phenylacetate--CoA ligase [Halarchaeum rubridurum]